jgi:hypothetical protein
VRTDGSNSPHECRIVVPCQRKDPHVRTTLLEPVCQYDAVHPGHRHIDDGDRGQEFLRELERLRAVHCLGDNLHLGLIVDQALEAITDQ